MIGHYGNVGWGGYGRAIDEITFLDPATGQPVEQMSPREVRRWVEARTGQSTAGLSADQIAALMSAGGDLTTGIAQLVHGGRRGAGDVGTASAPNTGYMPPTQGPNMGYILAGVGALLGVGLIAALVSSSPRR